MFKNQKFYAFIALFLALGVLFSACEMVKDPATTDAALVSTTEANAMPATTETPVLYSTGGLFPPSSDKIEASLCVVMRQFHWSGYGISTKFIEDKGYALKISGLLQDAPETGKILPALSEDEEWVTENSGFLPAKPGTLWIDTQNGYFRLTDDYSSLCRVENHLGEGEELEMSEELRALLFDLWSYYPYNYYSGTYQDGKLFIDHRFAARSAVDIIVKDIHIARKHDEKSTVTLELCASSDQDVGISLHCQQSDDNLGLGDGKILAMKENEPQTLTLSFVGWVDVGYEVILTADNTRLRIWIEP